MGPSMASADGDLTFENSLQSIMSCREAINEDEPMSPNVEEEDDDATVADCTSGTDHNEEEERRIRE